MSRLDIKFGKKRQCYTTKHLVHSFSVNIRICLGKHHCSRVEQILMTISIECKLVYCHCLVTGINGCIR